MSRDTVALVPVKHLGSGKSRLAGGLSRAGIDALTLAMLQDVLAAARAARSIGRVVVVTPDVAVAGAAQANGGEALLRDEPGLNPSLDAAAAQLANEGMTRLLVILGDVAGATARDLDALGQALDAQGGRGAVLAPARDGGTAALLRAPHDILASCFGPESAKAHRVAAEKAGVPFRALPLASLAIDLDRLEDARALLARREGATRTRQVLATLGVGEDA